MRKIDEMNKRRVVSLAKVVLALCITCVVGLGATVAYHEHQPHACPHTKQHPDVPCPGHGKPKDNNPRGAVEWACGCEGVLDRLLCATGW